MINPNLVVSASISGTFSALSIPGPINLTGSSYGPGGVDRYDVSELSSYSYQVYFAGSGINGTLFLQQSNNMTGWRSSLSQSVAAPGDQYFQLWGNNMAYARLLWNGTAASGSSVTVAVAGLP